MGEDDLDPLQRDLLAGDQAVPDRQVVLADQGEPVSVEGEGVEGRGDGSLDRVLERDQGAVGRPVAQRDDRVVDGGGGSRLDLLVADGRPEGVLAEGPRRPQVGDPQRVTHQGPKTTV